MSSTERISSSHTGGRTAGADDISSDVLRCLGPFPVAGDGNCLLYGVLAWLGLLEHRVGLATRSASAFPPRPTSRDLHLCGVLRTALNMGVGPHVSLAGDTIQGEYVDAAQIVMLATLFGVPFIMLQRVKTAVAKSKATPDGEYRPTSTLQPVVEIIYPATEPGGGRDGPHDTMALTGVLPLMLSRPCVVCMKCANDDEHYMACKRPEDAREVQIPEIVRDALLTVPVPSTRDHRALVRNGPLQTSASTSALEEGDGIEAGTWGLEHYAEALNEHKLRTGIDLYALAVVKEHELRTEVVPSSTAVAAALPSSTSGSEGENVRAAVTSQPPASNVRGYVNIPTVRDDDYFLTHNVRVFRPFGERLQNVKPLGGYHPIRDDGFVEGVLPRDQCTTRDIAPLQPSQVGELHRHLQAFIPAYKTINLRDYTGSNIPLGSEKVWQASHVKTTAGVQRQTFAGAPFHMDFRRSAVASTSGSGTTIINLGPNPLRLHFQLRGQLSDLVLERCDAVDFGPNVAHAGAAGVGDRLIVMRGDRSCTSCRINLKRLRGAVSRGRGSTEDVGGAGEVQDACQYCSGKVLMPQDSVFIVEEEATDLANILSQPCLSNVEAPPRQTVVQPEVPHPFPRTYHCRPGISIGHSYLPADVAVSSSFIDPRVTPPRCHPPASRRPCLQPTSYPNHA